MSSTNFNIVSWNILAPELLFYFWRSSYGLNAPKRPNSYYNNINQTRIETITQKLQSYSADIICLQEITNLKYPFLNNKTIQQYIADYLGFILISESFNQSPFKYGYPPNEQLETYKSEMGVATLINPLTVTYHNVTTADKFRKSELFDIGVGSPFTLDELILNNTKLYLVNLHIKMQYPHILDSVNEVYNRITSKIQTEDFDKIIVIGDFNAGGKIRSEELLRSQFSQRTVDLNNSYKNDRVLLGNSFSSNLINISYDTSVKILRSHVNKSSRHKVWNSSDINYRKSEDNQELIRRKIITSDHQPVMLTILF